MPRRQRKLDSAVESLVSEQLQANERVRDWSERGPGELVVFLIGKDMQAMCRESVRRFGRGAGCGRTLCFKREDGNWKFVGAGGWIS